MTIAFWCVLLAALAPYLTIAPAKVREDFDNNAPRAWEARLDGWRARLHAAHLNGFEAPQSRIDALAVAFVALRVAYVWLYHADKAGLRSVIWSIGMLCVIGLFVVAAIG